MAYSWLKVRIKKDKKKQWPIKYWLDPSVGDEGRIAIAKMLFSAQVDRYGNNPDNFFKKAKTEFDAFLK